MSDSLEIKQRLFDLIFAQVLCFEDNFEVIKFFDDLSNYPRQFFVESYQEIIALLESFKVEERARVLSEIISQICSLLGLDVPERFKLNPAGFLNIYTD